VGVGGTCDLCTDVILTDMLVQSHFNAMLFCSAFLLDTIIFETFTFSISTIFAANCIGVGVTSSVSLTFNIETFAFIFTTFLENVEYVIGWTVFIIGTWNGTAFMVLASFKFTAVVMANAINFFTLVGLTVTGMYFAVYIKWFTVCVGSAFDSFTFVLWADFLFSAEQVTLTGNILTEWILVICAIADLRCDKSGAIKTGITVRTVFIVLTFNWFTGIGTFFDWFVAFIDHDFFAVRETFVGCVVAITVGMSITFLFNTLVIVTVMFVWTVIRFDTLLDFALVLLANTFASFAVFIFVELTGIVRGTVNLFAEVLSWVLLVWMSAEMVNATVSIWSACNFYARVLNTCEPIAFGIAIVMALTCNWIASIMKTFIFFIFIVAKMGSFVWEFWIGITIERTFTFDWNTSFVLTFHTSGTVIVMVTCSDPVNFNDTLVIIAEGTLLVVWFVVTVCVFFAFLVYAFS
jgi:hypothetical protein